MIVWLASYPRSGNTFFRVILNSVFGIKTNSLSNDLNDIGADKATSDVVGHEFLAEGFNLDQARSASKSFYIKTHELPETLVRSGDKVIYLIRDGRESTLSFMKYDNTFGEQIDRSLMDVITGNIYFGSWGDHVRRWDPRQRKNTLLIRFEDLVESPSDMVKKIADFINVKPLGDTIPTFEELKKVNPRFFRSGKKDSWKEAYSEAELQEFWNKHHAILTAYDYTDAKPEKIETYPLKVSVITPSFNSVTYLERAVTSVLNQEYYNFEHIVVDAVSTDGTLDILKKYPHIRWTSEKDEGQADAMNKGFAMATGDVVVYLNADDYFLPGAFKSVMKAFESGATFVVGNVRRVYSDGTVEVQEPEVTPDAMLRHWEPNAFAHNPVQYFYKKEVQQTCGFNLDNHWAMDHEFLLEAVSQFSMTKIDRVLGVYSIVEGAKTVEGQKDPFRYWTHENFAYVDRFLRAQSADYIIRFKNDQSRFFIERMQQYANRIARRNRGLEQQVVQQKALLDKKPSPQATLADDPKCGAIKEAVAELCRHSAIRKPFRKLKAYKMMLRVYHANK